MDHIVVRTKDGVIFTPPSPEFLTTYVLIEQEDWFEKEIAFVRRLLRPGMRALDVGANYGIYTLSMAKAVGAQGAVWAFEPASPTVTLLRRSIEQNRLRNVIVRQLALSNRQGRARLRLEDNAEFNALSDEAGERTEEVAVATLDQEFDAQAFGKIDFVKLDAEGEEVNIVTGGERFFAMQSPLVMFEFKHGATINTELPDAFQRRGYELYRLIGPDWLLVPFHIGDQVDRFELNLFACKADRAESIAEVGLLTQGPAQIVAPTGAGLILWRRQHFASAFDKATNRIEPRYVEALDQYAVWRDIGRPLAERYGALLASLATLKVVAQASESLPMLSTLTRVAFEAGEQLNAVQLLTRMVNSLNNNRPQLDGPFWPVSFRYDGIAPGTSPEQWFGASVIEGLERLRALSSCFASGDTLPLLDWLQRTPFASAEMERRRQLMRMRARLQQGVVPTAILTAGSPDNLNPDYWRGAT